MEIKVHVDSENAQDGISNFHRVLLRNTLDIAQDSAEFGADMMREFIPKKSGKTAEGIHTVGPTLRSGPFGHPEVQYEAETDDIPGMSAARFFWFGTGLWGPLHRKIYASTYGKRAFKFKRFDGGNYTAVVKGQKPQRLWFEQSKMHTGNYVRARIETMLAQLTIRQF